MAMDIWKVIGAVGVVLTSVQLVPQIVKSLRTRQVRDLSLGLSVVVGLCALTWLAYGIHLRDAPLIIANAVNLAGAALLTALKLAGQPPA
jgi:MtN3 and saliva related transmembrane protein